MTVHALWRGSRHTLVGIPLQRDNSDTCPEPRQCSSFDPIMSFWAAILRKGLKSRKELHAGSPMGLFLTAKCVEGSGPGRLGHFPQEAASPTPGRPMQVRVQDPWPRRNLGSSASVGTP